MSIDFIIFGSRDWGNNWQTQHRLAASLSKKHRVLYIENTGVRSARIKDFPRLIQRFKNWRKSVGGFKKINQNLTIFSPLIFPFPYIKLFQILNSYLIFNILNSWIKKNRFNRINLISFLATPLVLESLEKLNFIVQIYYIGDNHSVTANNIKFEDSEKNISKNVDAVFSTSQKLKEKYEKLNKKTLKFPAGVELDKFKIEHDNKIIPNELANIKRPIVGFIGSMNEKINLNLVKKTIDKMPEYSFVFIGENTENRMNMQIFKNKNIFFIEKKNHNELKNYLKNFDCAIIPYNVNKFTETVYPSKLNEYLALGLPIVSTNFYEINYFNKEHDNIVNITADEDKFASSIANEIENDSENKQELRKIVAKKNSWSKRFEEIMTTINELNSYKETQKIEWEKSFKEEYNNIVKRIKNSLVLIFLTVFIFFVSPAPYYLGSILKINDLPQKSEIIIGLSGYGQATYDNNSYQQRALDIYYYYKRGFGDKIYLSGRKQVFEEFRLMKNILISFGVPSSKIYTNTEITRSTLDEVTYLNIFFKENNIKSANIITSSLHQLRTKLLFKKTNENFDIRFIETTNFEEAREKWFYPIKKQKIIAYEFLSIIYNLIKINVSK